MHEKVKDPAWWLVGVSACIFAAILLFGLSPVWSAVGCFVLAAGLFIEGVRGRLIGGNSLSSRGSLALMIGGFIAIAFALVEIIGAF